MDRKKAAIHVSKSSLESLARAISATRLSSSLVAEAFTDYLRQSIAEVARLKAELYEARHQARGAWRDVEVELKCLEDGHLRRKAEKVDVDALIARRDHLKERYEKSCSAYESVCANLTASEQLLYRWMSQPVDDDASGGFFKIMSSGGVVGLCAESEAHLTHLIQHLLKMSLKINKRR